MSINLPDFTEASDVDLLKIKADIMFQVEVANAFLDRIELELKMRKRKERENKSQQNSTSISHPAKHKLH